MLYNCKHKCGRLVVENEFGILKQTFREFLKKTKFHITIVLDMFNVCCLLHNLMLGRKKKGVEGFMRVIQFEALQEDICIEHKWITTSI
jgi:hypothetical protein